MCDVFDNNYSTILPCPPAAIICKSAAFDATEFTEALRRSSERFLWAELWRARRSTNWEIAGPCHVFSRVLRGTSKFLIALLCDSSLKSKRFVPLDNDFNSTPVNRSVLDEPFYDPNESSRIFSTKTKVEQLFRNILLR